MTHLVKSCVARQDGFWLVVTTKGLSAVCKSKVDPGETIRIEADGAAVKA